MNWDSPRLFYEEPLPGCCAITVLCDFDYCCLVNEKDTSNIDELIKEIKKSISSRNEKFVIATTKDNEEFSEVELALSYCGFEIFTTIPSLESKKYNINVWMLLR